MTRAASLRSVHNAPDAILIADTADFAIGKIDLDHVLRRAEQTQGLVGVSVEYLGGVIAALVGRDIGVVALDVEREPMRPRPLFMLTRCAKTGAIGSRMLQT
jgi:hypothetical protein